MAAAAYLNRIEKALLKKWEVEPDNVAIDHGDYHFIINRTPELGILCGYVGVPESHPLYQKEDNALQAHGGITYTGTGIHNMKPDHWYFGFDTGHHMDFLPGLMFTGFSPAGLMSVFKEENYKDIEYVAKEVRNLYDQLVEIAKEYAEISNLNVRNRLEDNDAT